MDHLPYDNLEQLVQVCHDIFSSRDVNVIRQSEMILAEMMKDLPRFTESMMDIVVSENPYETFPDVKRRALIVLSKALKLLNLLQTKNEVERIFFALVKGLDPNKPNLVIDGAQKLLQQICSLSEYILLKVSAEVLTKFSEDPWYSLQLAECIVYVRPQSNSMDELLLFSHLYPILIPSGATRVSDFNSEISKLEGLEVLEDQAVKVLTNKLELICKWALIVMELFNRIYGASQDNELAAYENFTRIGADMPKLLFSIIELKVPKQINLVPQCIVPTITTIPAISELINTTKSLAIECFCMVLEISQELESKNNLLDLNENQFFAIIRAHGVPVLLQNLSVLSKEKLLNIEAKLQDKYFRVCLTKCLKVLEQLVRYKKSDNIFFTFRNNIVIDICLPLISLTQEEVRLFNENPHDFIHTVVENEQEDIRLEALELMFHLCDYIDGALSYTIVMMTNLINHSLVSDDRDQLPVSSVLANYKESMILTHIPVNLRVDACLLTLGNLGPLVGARPDLFDNACQTYRSLVRTMFASFQDYFFGEQCDNLIRARMCTFLEDNLSVIFKDSAQLFESYLMLLVEFAGLVPSENEVENHQREAISTLAIKALNEVLFDEISQGMIPDMNQIFARMAGYLQYSQNLKLLEILKEILKAHKVSISQDADLVMSFVLRLVERLQIEIASSLHGSNDAPTNLGAMMWDIIVTISEFKEFLPFQDQIETHLRPVFLVTLQENLDFIQEALLYIQNIMKIQKQVPPIGWEVLKQLPKILAKIRYNISLVFPFLNLIIAYGKDHIENDQTMINFLVKVGTDSMNSESNEFNLIKVLIGALFLQTIIQYLTVQDDLWKKILMTCYRSLQEPFDDSLKAKIAGVILLAFHYDFQRTQSCLAENGVLGNVIELMISHPLGFSSHNYDMKLLTLSLSSFLRQEKIDKVIKDKLPQILHLLVSFLAFMQKLGDKKSFGKSEDDEEENGLKKKNEKALLKSILNGSMVSNEEDQDDEDSDISMDCIGKQDTVNDCMSNLVTRLDEKDEFKTFRETITQLKARDDGLLRKISQELPETHKQYMRDILSIQKIVIDQEKQEVKTRKILKVLRRKDKREDI